MHASPVPAWPGPSRSPGQYGDTVPLIPFSSLVNSLMHANREGLLLVTCAATASPSRHTVSHSHTHTTPKSAPVENPKLACRQGSCLGLPQRTVASCMLPAATSLPARFRRFHLCNGSAMWNCGPWRTRTPRHADTDTDSRAAARAGPAWHRHRHGRRRRRRRRGVGQVALY